MREVLRVQVSDRGLLFVWYLYWSCPAEATVICGKASQQRLVDLERTDHSLSPSTPSVSTVNFDKADLPTARSRSASVTESAASHASLHARFTGASPSQGSCVSLSPEGDRGTCVLQEGTSRVWLQRVERTWRPRTRLGPGCFLTPHDLVKLWVNIRARV